MADKTIGELPVADHLDDESLLVVEQQSQARSIKGNLPEKAPRGRLKKPNEQQKPRPKAPQMRQAVPRLPSNTAASHPNRRMAPGGFGTPTRGNMKILALNQYCPLLKVIPL